MGAQAQFAWQEHEGAELTAASHITTPIDWRIEGGDTIGHASVRLHCPDVGGECLTVLADLPADCEYTGHCFIAWTGTMTLWKRIYVDYFRMEGASDLPIEEVPLFFKDAMVEMVFTRKPEIAAVDPLFDSQDVSRLEAECLAFIDSIFSGEPGRFALLAALRPCHAPATAGSAQEPEEPRGVNATLGYGIRQGTGWFSLSYLEVEGDYTEGGTPVNKAMVILDFEKQLFFEGAILEAERFTQNRKVHTRLWLAGDDLAVEFTGHDSDGSVHHSSLGTRLYFLGREAEAPMDPSGKTYDVSNIQPREGGYPVLGQTQVRVYLENDPTAGLPGGMSPLKEVDGRLYYAGRTICFTSTEAYAGSQEDMLPFIVHELTHAFGLPHKCGRLDRRTPVRGVCAMNYPNHWILGSRGLIPRDESLLSEPFLCARHIQAIRNVRLERNPALGW